MSKLARDGGIPAVEVAEDTAVVWAMYRALEAGTGFVDPALARFAHAEIEWVHPMVTRLPFDGTRRGLADVLRSAFRRDAEGIGPRISAETFVEFGDGVLVAGRFIEDRSAEDGQDRSPFMHECFVRGGKIVVIREYPAESERGT